MTSAARRARYGPVLDELPLPDELLLLAELLLLLEALLLEALLLLDELLLVAVEVLLPEPADVVAAADVAVAVGGAPPVPSPLARWQFGFSLAPLFAGQQMSALPPSTSFETQTRFAPTSQSSLPVVGSLGVAETLRSQRWPSPWRPHPVDVRRKGRATTVTAAMPARIA
jgi:hypothetical protein